MMNFLFKLTAFSGPGNTRPERFFKKFSPKQTDSVLKGNMYFVFFLNYCQNRLKSQLLFSIF